MMGKHMYIKHGKEDEVEIDYHNGCLSGIIHAFDYHQWNYIRRINPKTKKYIGRRSSDGTGNIHTTLLQNQEFEQLFCSNERQPPGTRYSPPAHKRTLKSRIKVFSKLRNCKKQDSEFSPSQQLQRTYSLHRLEPSDRRLDEIWKNKKSEIGVPHGTLDSVNQSTKDVDIFESAKGTKELSQESERNGDDGTEMFLVMLPNFSGKERFIKSGSFPSADMSRKMNFSPSKLENKINEFFVSSEGTFQSVNNIQKYNEHFRAKSWNFTSDSEKMSIDKNLGEHFKSLKQELKDEEKNEAINPPEESQQIIQSSSKLSPLTVLQDEQPTDGDSKKDSKRSFVLDEDSDVKRNFIHRKSYSLSDSLTRYSRLLEFTSRPGIELHTSKSLKLRNEYDPPSTTNISFKRIHSLSHIDSYFPIREDEQGLPLETVPENGSFVEEDTNDEEIQNETVERMGDEVSLEGQSSIYAGDLEDTFDNRIMIRIKEEDANCSVNTAELIPTPIQDSNARCLEEKSIRNVSKAYSSMDLENAHEKDSDMYYVRKLLARSSFFKDITNELWISYDHPLTNDDILEKMEADWHQEIAIEKEESYEHYTHHQILFDIVNEAILHLHDRTSLYYPKTLSSICQEHLTPIGRRIEEEIIATTRRFLSRKAKQDQSLDDIVCEDVIRDNEWMNLHSESECVAMELEDIVADELLEELLFEDLLELH
ncbi:hypothetical protein Leryth_009575 [Lithospermum erythrorhizon]|nr:hypothetical protein Leryth_009575 [Lithospermum erythrorhizon]